MPVHILDVLPGTKLQECRAAGGGHPLRYRSDSAETHRYTAGMSTPPLAAIGLAPAQLRAVEKKARRAGTTAPEYVRALIERDLMADQSFDEILRPVRADFERHGVTGAQLDGIVQRARAARPRSRSAKAKARR